MFGFPITGYKHILSICLQHTHTAICTHAAPAPIGDRRWWWICRAQCAVTDVQTRLLASHPLPFPSLPPSLPFPLCLPRNHCLAVRHQSIANRKQISNQANWSLGLLWGLGPALSLWPGCGWGGNGIRGKGQAHCLPFAGGPHLRNKKLQAGRGAVAGAERQGWGGFRWG